MRLDKYLKVSRLIKRRTLAKDAAEQERIFVNNKPAKPSKELKIGDIIIVEPGEKIPLDGVIIEGKTDLDTSSLKLILVDKDGKIHNTITKEYNEYVAKSYVIIQLIDKLELIGGCKND